MTCIFCRIARGEVPAKVVYQDDDVIAFHDISPQAPVHVLVIPRQHIASAAELTTEDRSLAGALLIATARVAELTGIAAAGYRILSNVRENGGQEVPHLHIHVVGGRRLGRMLPG